MSPAMGSLAWTSVVSDFAVIEDTETKLAADPGYLLCPGTLLTSAE
jgi:hypothetical protein